MFSYVLKRLMGLIPTLFLVGVMVFLFVHLLPGDPARLAAGPEADENTVAMVRTDLGLDLPIHQQFVRFVVNAVHGNFGISLRTKLPVTQEIMERFWPTLWLTITSMVWAVVFGLLIGIFSAVWRNEWPDRVGMTLAVSSISFPPFALGMVLMEVFAVQLGWLPTVGADSWRHYILPSLTLGAGVAAIMARFTRSSFIEILKEDFVRTARAKGLHERVVVAKHCADSGRDHDGFAVRLFARWLDRGRKSIQLARYGTLAGRRGRDARLSDHSSRDPAVLVGIHFYQSGGGRAVRGHQSEYPLQVRRACQLLPRRSS